MRFVKILAILYFFLSVILIILIPQSKIDTLFKSLFFIDVILAFILVEWYSVFVIRKNTELNKLQEENKNLRNEIDMLEQSLSGAEDESVVETVDKNDIKIEIKGDTEEEYFKNLLSVLAEEIGVVEGLFFKKENDIYRVIATFAYYFEDENDIDFKEGEGINGQVVKDQKILVLSDIPKGFAKVYSGLGESYPKYIIYWPIVIDGETKYLAELATFTKVNEKHINLLRKLESHLNEINFQ